MNLPTRRDPNALASFTDPSVYGQLVRAAGTLAKASIIPATFRGKPEDCFVALHIAHRLSEDPFVIMQNMFVVHGTPGWKTSYVIARARASGVFSTPIEYDVKTGKEGLSVTASATLAASKKKVSETVSMVLAESEGWTKSSKYKSMPEHMLKWRAAAWLIRRHAPEVMLGMQTVAEIHDIQAAGEADPEADFIDSEVVAEEVPQEPPRPEPTPVGVVTDKQRKRAYGIAKSLGIADPDATIRQLMVEAGCVDDNGEPHWDRMTRAQYDTLCDQQLPDVAKVAEPEQPGLDEDIPF